MRQLQLLTMAVRRYFSKGPIYTKPTIWSVPSNKENWYTEFTKAKKVNGEMGKLKRSALVPKHYRAIHPTVSPDGKKDCFFASNMPGTFGKLTIRGQTFKETFIWITAKKSRSKSKHDDMTYIPKIIEGSSLVLHSEGRKVLVDFDVYMVQVDHLKK